MDSKIRPALGGFIRPSSAPILLSSFLVMLLFVSVGAIAQTVTFSGAQSAIPSISESTSQIAVDLAGNIYTVESAGSTYSLVRIQRSGSKTVLQSNFPFYPRAIAVNPQGTKLYYIHSGPEWPFPSDPTVKNTVYLAKTTIAANDTATTTEIPHIFTLVYLGSNWTTAYTNPMDLTIDSAGNVYVCDQGAGSFWFIPAGSDSPSRILGLTIGQPWNIALSVDGSKIYFTYGDYRLPSGQQQNAIGWVSTSSYAGSDYAVPNTLISNLNSIQSGLVVDSAGTLYVGGYNSTGDPVVFKVTGTNPSNSALTPMTPPGSGTLSSFGVDSGQNLYMGGDSGISYTSFTGVGMGSVNVGYTSSSLPLQFYFNSGGTLGSVDVLTEGVSGLEFFNAGGGAGTCNTTTAFAAASTCRVNVTFSPTHTGLRKGAVVLKNSSGAIIATVFIYGIGLGPQVAFSPAAESSIGTSLVSPSNVAVDSAGNVYIAHSNGVVKETPSGGTYTQSVVSSTAGPRGVAVDGAGNVFISYASTLVKATPSGGSYALATIASGLNNPTGIAVDGSGNVYVAEKGGGRILKEAFSANVYGQSALLTGITSPSGIAVDAFSNIYIANSGASILKETLSGSGYTQSTIGSALSNPTAVVIDGNGNLYIADSGNHRIVKETLAVGSYAQSEVANSGTNGLYNPTGVAIERNGNVYIADQNNNRVLRENFANGSLNFSPVIMGATSSDSPKELTVTNIGNAQLDFRVPGAGLNNPSISTYFTLGTGGVPPCPRLTSTSPTDHLSVSSSCDYLISFSPTTWGNMSGSLILANNAWPGSQTVGLSGVGLSPVSVSPATLSDGAYGQAYSVALSATGGASPYTFSITSGALPSGITLGTDGVFSGSTNYTGTFSFTVTASDSTPSGSGGPFHGDIAYTLKIDALTVSIAPATLGGATVGSAYNSTITASGGTASYSYTVTAGTLPAGLSLNSSTGVLSGTPTAGGTFNFTVTATDSSTGSGPFTANRPYSITVAAPTITVAPATLSGGTVGSSYNQSITASGGTATYTYVKTAGTLPAGLSLSSAGVLSGIPTAGGTFNFTVTATDSSTGLGAPYSASRAYPLSIAAPTISLTPASLPSATVATAYNQTITASGGTAIYSYAITAGALPAGLSLSSAGVFSGTPSAGGTFNFTVTATDSSTGSGPFTGSRAYTVSVNAPTITLAPASLADGTVAINYSQSVSASGGTANYSYAITAGALPAGVALSSAGVLSGTPTAGGTFNFTVTATDSSTGAGPYVGSQVYTLKINAPTISIAPMTLGAATVGSAYDTSISASGGVPSYSYAVTAGALPAGLSLGTTGTLSGTPTAGGTFNFTVTATDSSTGSGPYTGSRTYSLTVDAPTITVSPASLAGGAVGAAYAQSLSASGGTASYTYAITSGALPAGLTLSSSGVLSGTPTAGGTFNFTITATDSSTGAGPYTGSRAYTLVVNAPSITVSPATIVDGTYNASYSQTLTAAGGTAAYTFAVTAGALPPGLVLSPAGVLSGSPTATGIYNFTVTATDSSTGTGPYSASRAYTVTIAKAAATVTLGDLTQTYTGSSLSVTSTTTPSGLNVEYSYSKGGVTVTPIAAGSYAVTATINDSNYQGSTTGTLVIEKAAATVTLGNLTQTYTGSTLAVTSTTMPPGLNVDYSYTQSGVTVTPIGAGTYAVTATINDSNYHGSATGTLVIEKANATVTLTNLTQTYTGSPLSASASTTPPGFTVDLTYDGASAAPTNAGRYSAIATINDNNYQGTTNGTLVIDKAPGTITLNNLNLTYTGSPLAITSTTTPAGLNVDYTYTQSGAPATPIGAGSYAVTATINETNYQGSASGTLVINKAPATVSLGNLNQTYTGSPLAASATTAPPGLAVDLSYNGSAAIPTDSANYSVVGAINDSNYQGSASGTLVVAKATLTVTPTNTTMTYGATLPGLTGTIAGAAATDGITASYATTATSTSSIGPYSITATLDDPNTRLGNYLVTRNEGLLSVQPATLTVTAASATTTYNMAVPTLTGVVTGLANNDPISVTYSTAASQGSNAGTYPITATVVATPAVLANYTVSKTEGTLTIDKAPGTGVTLNTSATTDYYGQTLTFTAHVANTAGTPDGAVAFYDGGTLLATLPLTNGTASYSSSAFIVGTHALTAVYEGNLNYVGATSSVLNQTVLAPLVTINDSGTGGSLGTITLVQGGTGSLRFQVASLGTLASDVSLACSGLPSGLTCQITPSSLNRSALPAAVTVTVSAAKYRILGSNRGEQRGLELGWALAMLVPGMLIISRKKTTRVVVLLVIAAALLVGMTACGGGAGITNAAGVTPPGTYTATVTGSYGSTQSISSTITVVVQQ